MSLENAWNSFAGVCSCAQPESNNCAHYLSHALILSGYSELDGGKGANQRNKNGFLVCAHGRPIRAKELRAWAAKKGTRHTKQPGGVSFVYQERPADGQGHVLLKNGSAYKGTGDYPTWTQEYYTF